MRLFIAVNLGNNSEIAQTISAVRKVAESANYTRDENLHMTLAFLGEVRSSKSAIDAMESVEAFPFRLTFDRLGKFNSDEEATVWLGCEPIDELKSVHRSLCVQLADRGFVPEERKLTPHITLARRAILKAPLPKVQPITVRVSEISLMRSDRISGKLTYTEMFTRPLR